jgi:uncharacterized membrane protein YkvA (DUF1232 family)
MKLDNTTWRGLIAVIGAMAIILKPADIAIIVPAVLGLIGTINIIREP